MKKKLFNIFFYRSMSDCRRKTQF